MSEQIQSIAQNNYILAKQQEVSHDNTLSGNGTVDSPLGVVPGYNETVLWSGTPATTVTSINLSESWKNFQTIKLYGRTEGGVVYSEFDTDDMINKGSNKEASLSNGGFYTWGTNSYYVNITIPCIFNNELTISSKSSRYVGYWEGSWQAKEVNYYENIITKIVGINRKA